MAKTVSIRCKTLKTIPLSSLQALQGNLKELRESEYLKLRRSIEKHGFRFPIFVWGCQIIDGHQRLFTLKKMISEGWDVPEVPVVEIEAASKREAMEMVLLNSSRYGHMTEEGLDEFVTVAGLDLGEVKEETDFPEIDWGYFEQGAGGEEGESSPGPTCTCPTCGNVHGVQ